MELVDKDLELYRQYQELQNKGIINCQIAAQLQITNERLASIISHYTFKTGLEYNIQEQEGKYRFNGSFYLSRGVLAQIDKKQVAELFIFVHHVLTSTPFHLHQCFSMFRYKLRFHCMLQL